MVARFQFGPGPVIGSLNGVRLTPRGGDPGIHPGDDLSFNPRNGGAPETDGLRKGACLHSCVDGALAETDHINDLTNT